MRPSVTLLWIASFLAKTTFTAMTKEIDWIPFTLLLDRRIYH